MGFSGVVTDDAKMALVYYKLLKEINYNFLPKWHYSCHVLAGWVIKRNFIKCVKNKLGFIHIG
jgi:hypothetical protein